ncbi:MAG: flavodoxin domain-containing protein, partial [Clostridiales bacterium]|nr:flavodoxin domain-containing protein [Clostridiales bacterium]
IMSDIAVIYSSKHGHTKRYAEWIAQALNAELLKASAVKPAQLASFGLIVYGGPLYAGGIDGIKLVTKNPCKSLVIFTVGLADPATTDYTTILNKNFSGAFLAKTGVFHLRGGLDHKNLGPIHKMIIGMVRKVALKKDASERTEEEELFLQAYNTKIDFTDKNTILPLVNHINSIIEGA